MSETLLILESRTPKETEAVGAALARLLPPGANIALRGELATGKTCLVRGMASHFAASDLVHSPTFTLVNEYGDESKLYHVDLYRVGDAAEAADLGLEELFESDGICAIEWAERAEALIPAQCLNISLEHVEGDRRRIIFLDPGLLPSNWRTRLAAALDQRP